MALATAAAIAGAGTAAALYLDGKYHLRQDLRIRRGMNLETELVNQAVKEKKISLYYLFEESVQRLGGEECIWSRTGCYSWNETYDMVHRWAQWYISQGVRTGDLVAFYLHNSPEFMFAWLGLHAIGAAPAMINYNLADKALLHCMKISGATLVLVDNDEPLRRRVEDEREIIENELKMSPLVVGEELLAHIRGLKPQRPDNACRDGVQPDWPMCIFYTSGTTGLSKGVSFQMARGYRTCAGRKAGTAWVKDDDRWYDSMPLYHGTGGVTAMVMMSVGVTLCIAKRFSTSRFWSDIRDSRATWFVYVGETARYLLAAPPSPLDRQHNLRAMYGNGLRPDVWERFQERFGVSEVAEFFNSSEGVFVLFNHSKNSYRATCVGHHGLILRNTYKNILAPVLIDSTTGAIARSPRTGFAIRQPYSSGGEMIVRLNSESEFAGYWNNPDATAKKYERDVFEKGDLWYRTGDALRRDDDGKWFFIDRLGDTYRWKGENVSTAEVAQCLGTFKGVVEANVYGVQLPGHDGRAGCAAVFIDPAEREGFDYAGLLRHARASLPKYAVPIFIRVVQEMTPIHNNKQNKVPLRNEGVDPDKVKPGDVVLFAKAGSNTYEPFTRKDWDAMVGGLSRL